MEVIIPFTDNLKTLKDGKAANLKKTIEGLKNKKIKNIELIPCDLFEKESFQTSYKGLLIEI